jgi:hypothetical protein
MKNAIIGLVCFWLLALLLHWIKIILTKKYTKKKNYFDENPSEVDVKTIGGRSNKLYIHMFDVYVKSLDQGKIACIIFGVLVVLRELFLG